MSGRPIVFAVTREHWRAVDPTLRVYAGACDDLRSRWHAQKPLRGWKIGAHHVGGRVLLGLQTSLLGLALTETDISVLGACDLLT